MTFMGSRDYQCPECGHMNGFPVVLSYNWRSEPAIAELGYGSCWGCGHVWFLHERAGYDIKMAYKLSDWTTWSNKLVAEAGCKTWSEYVKKMIAEEGDKQ
jgi:hypothetical protein